MEQEKEAEIEEQVRYSEELWDKFVSIVSEHKAAHPGEPTYFSFEFIEKLGLGKLTVLFLFSEHDIGTQQALGHLATKTLLEDPTSRFFFVRDTQKDLIRSFSKYKDLDFWPWLWRYDTKELKLKRKHTVFMSGVRPENGLVGWGTLLNFKSAFPGSGNDYRNVKYLVWDACNVLGKEGVSKPWIVMGNLQKVLEDYNPSITTIVAGRLIPGTPEANNNHILDNFKMPPETKLRYVEDKDSGDKILYIRLDLADGLFGDGQ